LLPLLPFLDLCQPFLSSFHNFSKQQPHSAKVCAIPNIPAKQRKQIR
jgi:hypothetical protein